MGYTNKELVYFDLGVFDDKSQVLDWIENAYEAPVTAQYFFDRAVQFWFMYGKIVTGDLDRYCRHII